MRAVRGVLLACCGMHVASCVADSVYSIMASHSMLPLRAMVSRPVSACVTLSSTFTHFLILFSPTCVCGGEGIRVPAPGRSVGGWSGRGRTRCAHSPLAAAQRGPESDDSPRAATSTFYTF